MIARRTQRTGSRRRRAPLRALSIDDKDFRIPSKPSRNSGRILVATISFTVIS